MSKIREAAIRGLKPGDTLSVTRTFTEEEILLFADISLDYNPIHFDRRFCDTKGFTGPVCHGLLVGGMLTEIGGQLGMLASGMNFRFRRPVYVGDTVTCTLTFSEIDPRGRAKARVDYTNQDGEIVVEAELFGILPVGDSREVLRTMVAEGDATNKLRQG